VFYESGRRLEVYSRYVAQGVAYMRFYIVIYLSNHFCTYPLKSPPIGLFKTVHPKWFSSKTQFFLINGYLH